MSGMAALGHSLACIGRDDVGDLLARRILTRVKEVGQTGRAVSLTELGLIVRALEGACGEKEGFEMASCRWGSSTP